MQKTNEELEKNVTGFEPQVIEMFMNYTWPGNLREFRNVVRRAVLLTQGDLISEKTLPWEITNVNPLTATPEPLTSKEQGTTITLKKEFGLKGAASKAEYETIMSLLKEVNNNKSELVIHPSILEYYANRKELHDEIENDSFNLNFYEFNLKYIN